MPTITQPMSPTSQILAPPTAHLMLTGPTSTFHEFGMANLKLAIDHLAKYKPTITASGMLIPKFIIIDTLGWDELYTGLYTQPSYPSLPLTILAPSASRQLGTKSCVRDGKIEKEVKWIDEIPHAFANFTRENEASGNSIYKHPHLRTIYTTYPHPDEHLPAAPRYVLEKCYMMQFQDKLEKQRMKSCQGRCGEVKIALLSKLRNEEYEREWKTKRDYDAYINEGVQKKRGCSVRVMEVIEEEEE